MAKHKAATEITIAQEERSGFAEFVDQYKWMGLGLLAVIAGVIVWMNRSSTAAVNEKRSDWNALYEALQSGDGAEAIANAAAKIQDPKVAAMARISQVTMLSEDRDYASAEQALGQALEHAPPILSKVKFPSGPEGEDMTLMKQMESSLAAEASWMKTHSNLFENPPLPEGSPQVTLKTSKGDIVVGFYLESAPQHVKNFIKLAEEGYYDGTRFHRIQAGGFIQGGDPNSRDEDASTWGMGGPETKIPKEDSKLVHEAGVLAAAKRGGDTDSSGSQFYLTAGPKHEFDGNYVVYGKVIEGLDLITEISNAELRDDKPETPLEPVVLESTIVSM